MFQNSFRINGKNYQNCFIFFKKEYLDAMCSSFLGAVFNEILPTHPVWSSRTKVSQLATSMVTIYANLKKSFPVDQKSHYIFTPKHLSDWCLGLVRYIIQVSTIVRYFSRFLKIHN